MSDKDIERLINYLSKLPGLGPRSARRATLHLLKRRENIMEPLILAMQTAADNVKPCNVCGNLDSINPCKICVNRERDQSIICVVEDGSDLWALERTHSFKGYYHVLGGLLSALDGIGPDDLNIERLVTRAASPEAKEIILAMSATVDGQTTAHFVVDCLNSYNVKITRLAHGVPVGGELDYLDDGTLSAALKSRSSL